MRLSGSLPTQLQRARDSDAIGWLVRKQLDDADRLRQLQQLHLCLGGQRRPRCLGLGFSRLESRLSALPCALHSLGSTASEIAGAVKRRREADQPPRPPSDASERPLLAHLPTSRGIPGERKMTPHPYQLVRRWLSSPSAQQVFPPCRACAPAPRQCARLSC